MPTLSIPSGLGGLSEHRNARLGLCSGMTPELASSVRDVLPPVSEDRALADWWHVIDLPDGSRHRAAGICARPPERFRGPTCKKKHCLDVGTPEAARSGARYEERDVFQLVIPQSLPERATSSQTKLSAARRILLSSGISHTTGVRIHP
jgi:hypothetical protein